MKERTEIQRGERAVNLHVKCLGVFVSVFVFDRACVCVCVRLFVSV